MPYIVTTSTSEECEGGTALFLKPVSRRAVATLDEARTAAVNTLAIGLDGQRPSDPTGGEVDDWPGELELSHTAATLPEQGGTVGPLPDGSLIEVERKSGYAILQMIPAGQRPHRERGGSDMHRERGGDGSAYFKRIIAAYNATQ